MGVQNLSELSMESTLAYDHRILDLSPDLITLLLIVNSLGIKFVPGMEPRAPRVKPVLSLLKNP